MANGRNRSDPAPAETPAHVLESIERHMVAQNLSLSANGRMLAEILALLKEQLLLPPDSMTSAEVVGALTPAVERLEGVGATPPEPPKP